MTASPTHTLDVDFHHHIFVFSWRPLRNYSGTGQLFGNGSVPHIALRFSPLLVLRSGGRLRFTELRLASIRNLP
jgi:hypothetical protein